MLHALSVGSANPRTHPLRVRHRRIALRLTAVSSLSLYTACHDDGTGPAALSQNVTISMTAASSTTGLDKLATRLSSQPGACILAERTPKGGYRSQSLMAAVSPSVAFATGPTTRFAYRGWSAGQPEPVILGVCTIPDTPAARAQSARYFGSRPMNAEQLRAFALARGVTAVEDWGPGTSPHVMQGAVPVHMTDGSASDFPKAAAQNSFLTIMSTPVCDPAAIIPEPGCEEETVPDEPPPSDGPDNSLIDPGLEPAPPPEIVPCVATTDYAHISTTPGFAGRINVKSRNQCVESLPQFVSSTLKRQSCFLWIFCSWPTIGYGTDQRVNTWAEAKANSECLWEKGWYKGHGFHQTTWPQGVGSTRTYSPPRRINC